MKHEKLLMIVYNQSKQIQEQKEVIVKLESKIKDLNWLVKIIENRDQDNDLIIKTP